MAADLLQPNIKQLQIQLTGFLEKETPVFCKELWQLCLSAQASTAGVPKELLEAKKMELRQEKVRDRLFPLLSTSDRCSSSRQRKQPRRLVGEKTQSAAERRS
jgi:serine/arginine repetitive matrix protein 1